MSAECDQLRVELQRISSQIAALDNRYMLASERQPINSALSRLRTGLETVKQVADTAKAVADLAKELAGIADGKAGRAFSLAEAAYAVYQVILNELRQYVLRERFNALENRLTIVENSLNSFISALQAVNRRALEALSRLDVVELDIRVIKRNLLDLRDRLTNLLGRVVDLEQWRQVVDARLRQIERDIYSIYIRVNTLEDYVEELKAKVRALEIWRTAIQAQVVALIAAVGVLTAGLAALTATVTALGKVVAVLVAKMAVVIATLTGLVRSVASLLVQMAIVRSTLTGIIRQIARLFAQLTALTARVSRVENLARRALSVATQAYDRAQEAYSVAIQARGIARLALEKANAALSLAQAAYQIGSRALTRALENTIRIGQLDFRIQILERLMQEIRAKLDEIKQLLTAPFGGSIDLTPCNAEEDDPTLLLYDGNGLVGLSSAVNSMAIALQTLNENTRCAPSENTNAALPMYFETRPGEVPQLVILWGPVDGGASRWSLTVPHPRSVISDKYFFNFPPYFKGNYHFTYRLTDNSQIILNSASPVEGNRVLNYLKTLVDPAFINVGQLPKITKNAGQGNLANVRVKATFVKAFEGHRNQAPLWTKNL